MSDPKYGAYDRAKELGKQFQGQFGTAKGGGVSANSRRRHPLARLAAAWMNMFLNAQQKDKKPEDRVQVHWGEN